ncbi:hypothetical protein EXU57_04890 [Segetibacter sp. 3557_3]|uniref:hypothetical protein n=1 Tax=Segetibacter sp. 3557_3 TaxID=2547429 RepID=UPI001058E228|nr:hypothetical protein [Segetibacter sp. 3557_3]TDH27810.1 hypothetical protein EXU57_04890 [Segetibacter sp. 3557_3]
MAAIDFTQLLTAFGVSYLLVLFFIAVGECLTRFFSHRAQRGDSVYAQMFYRFFTGLVFVVSCYSIVVASGRSINLVLVPLLFLFLHFHGGPAQSGNPSTSKGPQYGSALPELGLIVFVSVLVLFIAPESEYKQADSFFYLKIAESLNQSGQENLSHYFNRYSSFFHGTEPYHYFDLWLTAIITRITGSFHPAVFAARYIGAAVLLSGTMLALYSLCAVLFHRGNRLLPKLFCWSLLFFMPNFLGLSSWLYQVFISDFEGSFLERPNFRVIYLVFIPVFIEVYRYKQLTIPAFCLLLMVSVFSFTCAVVIIPALVVYSVYLFINKNRHGRHIFWGSILFSVCYAGFYLLFPVRGLASIYDPGNSGLLHRTLQGWKFIIYAITMSGLYLMVIYLLFIGPLFLINKNVLREVINRLKPGSFALLLIIASGIVIARLLYQKDNAYQFLFISDIVVLLLIWISILLFASNYNNKLLLPAAIVFFGTWAVRALAEPQMFFVDTFRQNGNLVYEGRKYAAPYLDAVQRYFRTNRDVVGGYIADSTFYRSIHYSRRNPNVYFLPLTYIVSATVNKNFEFCLSSPEDILSGITYPLEAEYLNTAVNRSYYLNYKNTHKGLSKDQLLYNFIREHDLAYLIVTGNVQAGPAVLSLFRNQVSDPVTGEKFLY